jgi:hypothetical protein
LQVKLIGGLGGDELHRRPLHRLGNCLGVTEVVLLSLGVRTHVLRWHQPRIVAKRSEPTTEVMSSDASLHADQTGRHVCEPHFHLATRPLLPEHNLAALIEPDDVE